MPRAACFSTSMATAGCRCAVLTFTGGSLAYAVAVRVNARMTGAKSIEVRVIFACESLSACCTGTQTTGRQGAGRRTIGGGDGGKSDGEDGSFHPFRPCG